MYTPAHGPDLRARLLEHQTWVLLAIYLGLFAILSPWYVEDAAISFSYAHHAATGEGFVAYPGGERVEGFSNPSWTLLLTALSALKISPWVAAKLLGALFGAGTLLLTSQILRELSGPERPAWIVSVGPLSLALGPQFLIWNASGLENALLGFLMVWSLRVAMMPRPPWEALGLGLLAITRPEAPLYALLIGLCGAQHIGRNQGATEGIKWLVSRGVMALTPLLAWELWSYQYFGWWLPNTYYAKLVDGEINLALTWGERGWVYLLKSLARGGWLYIVPFLMLSQIGWTRRRVRWLGAGLTLFFLVLLPSFESVRALVGIPGEEPASIALTRIALLAVGLTLLPLWGPRDSWAPLRRTCWWIVLGVAGFIVHTGGDWMSGFRWLSLAVVPLAFLLTDACAQAWSCSPRSWSHRLAVLIAAVPVTFGGVQYVDYLDEVETTPFDVYRRVAYMQNVQDRLHLDHASLLEVDFGAHMWWSGDTLIDLAGLNDVAMAHHVWEQPFLEEYLYAERSPDFLHAHGGWANRTGVTLTQGYRDYVEIPGYPSSRSKFHVGNHVRRDLLFKRRFSSKPGHKEQFQGDVQLEGWRVDAPFHTPGGHLHIDLGWRRGAKGAQSFRAVLFLSGNDQLLTWELPPAYDWVEVKDWQPEEIAIGRHTMALPSDLEPGAYALGIVVLGPQGILRAHRAHPLPSLAQGEVRWASAIQVLSPDRAEQRKTRALAAIQAAIEEGRCHHASERLDGLRWVFPEAIKSPYAHPPTRRALSRCWARKAEGEPSEAVMDLLNKARHWDADAPTLRNVARRWARVWVEQGEAHLAAGDLESAQTLFLRALGANPLQPTLRRRVEAIRDERLFAEEP